MLRRTAFRRKEAPPSLARVREWHGAMPTPRAPARAVCELARVPVVPLPKENLIQHAGYMNLVRALPCAHCFKPPRSQFCHRDEGKGTGIKTDCREGWPGCAECHRLIGTVRILPKRERQAIELLYGKETRAKVLASGKWPKRLPLWEEA